MRIYEIPLPDERSFDEQMKDGKSLDDGLAGSKPLFNEWEKPFRSRHKPTRCNHDEDPGSY